MAFSKWDIQVKEPVDVSQPLDVSAQPITVANIQNPVSINQPITVTGTSLGVYPNLSTKDELLEFVRRKISNPAYTFHGLDNYTDVIQIIKNATDVQFMSSIPMNYSWTEFGFSDWVYNNTTGTNDVIGIVDITILNMENKDTVARGFQIEYRVFDSANNLVSTATSFRLPTLNAGEVIRGYLGTCGFIVYIPVGYKSKIWLDTASASFVIQGFGSLILYKLI